MKAVIKMMVLMLVVVVLAGCQTTPFYKEPAIVDISDSKVVVQLEHSNFPGYIFASKNTANLSDVGRAAHRGCSQYADKTAVLLSKSCGRQAHTGGTYGSWVCVATNYLYACRDDK